jgi:hypothetical protein
MRACVPKVVPRAVFETMEARVLYSADFAPLEQAAAVPAAETRTLDATGEFTGNADAIAQARRHEIAFVDAAAPASLLEGLARNGSPGCTLEVVLVSHDRDGITQVSEVLSSRRDVSAVHIISHGTDGAVQLGAGRLDFDSLLAHASRIRGWGDALASNADLLIYGCDVAQGSAGASLMQALARLTGADVAASSDRTAGAAQGGNWTLEYRTGSIETQQALDDQVAAGWSGTLAIAPTVVAPAAQSASEDVPVAIAGVSVADPEADLTAVALSVGNGSLRVDLSGGAGVGAGANQSAAMTVTGSQAQINAALATLVYQGAADASGIDAVSIVATDASGDSDSAAVPVTVDAVNDAPSVTAPATRITTENRQVVFLPGQVRIADVDAGAAPLQVTITAVNGLVSVGGTAGLTFTTGDGRSDSVMTFSGTLATINAALNNLRFMPTADFTGLAQMTLQVSDAGSSGAGGAQSGIATVLITVNAEDDIASSAVLDAIQSLSSSLFIRTADSSAAPGASGVALPAIVHRDPPVLDASTLAARLALSAGGPESAQERPASADADSSGLGLATRGGWPVRVGAQWLAGLVPANTNSGSSGAQVQGSVSPPAVQPVVRLPELAAVPGVSSGMVADAQRGAPQGADEEEVARLEQALTYVLGAAMSAGAVLWANRSLGLLAPVAMSMPAWKGIDPLPAVAPEDVADEYPADHQDILDQAAESMVFRSARGGGLQA